MSAGGMLTAGLIGGGISLYGAIKKAQDAKAAANNPRPVYNIPQEEYENQQLATSQAGQGMSASARQAYQNSADAGLATTTNAILKGGGDPNTIGSAYNNYQNGINNLSIYDDQVRMQHLNGLLAQNRQMAADKDKAWQVNQFAPWADKSQALALKQQGDQQLMGQGLGILGGAASSIAGHFANPNKAIQPTGGGPSNNVASDIGSNNFSNNFGYSANNNFPNFTNNYGGSMSTNPPANQNGGNMWSGIGIIPYQ